MANKPFMQFYVADYLGDTSHLTTLEHGAYLLLILAYWQSGKPIPSNNERITNVVRMSYDEWMKIRDTIAEFFIDDGFVWRHKRIEIELDRFKSKSEAARQSVMKRYERSTNVVPTNNERTTIQITDTDTDNRIQKKKERVKKTEVAPSVTLTTEEHQKLTDEFGVTGTADRVKRLSLYKQSTGKKYKSDYATILSWARKDEEKGGTANGNNRSGGGGAPKGTDGTPPGFWA